jgi:hypothetical protein
VLDRLNRLRGPGEGYSDVILWIAAETRGSNTVTDQTKPESQPADKSMPSGPDIAAIHAVEVHWASEEREHHRKERFYWWITAILTFVAVAGAVTTVILSQLSLEEARRATKEAERATAEAHRQADEAQRQADVTESSLRDNRAQFATLSRASVSLKDIELIPSKDGDKVNWYFEPTFDNNGSTPTRELGVRVNYIATSTDLPTGFSRCTFDSPDVRISIGPRSSTTFQIIPIPSNAIDSFQRHIYKHFYIWGKSTYLDTVTGDTHKTRFCWDIPNITGDPNEITSKITLIHGLCLEGNCIDGECDKEDGVSYSIPNNPGGCRLAVVPAPK